MSGERPKPTKHPWVTMTAWALASVSYPPSQLSEATRQRVETAAAELMAMLPADELVKLTAATPTYTDTNCWAEEYRAARLAERLFAGDSATDQEVTRG